MFPTTVDIDMSRVKPDRKWVVIIGSQRVPSEANKFEEIFFEGPDIGSRFSLVRIADFDFSIDLLKNKTEWPLLSLAGSGNILTAEYDAPIAKRVRVHIELSKTDPANQHTYMLAIEGFGQPVTVMAQKEGNNEYVLEGDGTGKALALQSLEEPAVWPERIVIEPLR